MEKAEGNLVVEDKRFSAQPSDVPAVTSSNDVLMAAIQKNYTPELIEKMMDLQERFEKNEARKAYVVAITKFKADPPQIYKDKVNSQFKSKYSSIDALVNPSIPHLSKYGLSHSWTYDTTGEILSVTCILTHELGHSDSVTMSAPPDTSGAKNPLQERKSTLTYLKISTFEGVTGLVSKEGNLDDDGNGAGSKKDTEKFDKWVIDCDLAGEAANSVEDMAKWWGMYSKKIKADLTAKDAAKIFKMVVDHKERLKSDSEPGANG